MREKEEITSRKWEHAKILGESMKSMNRWLSSRGLRLKEAFTLIHRERDLLYWNMSMCMYLTNASICVVNGQQRRTIVENIICNYLKQKVQDKKIPITEQRRFSLTFFFQTSVLWLVNVKPNKLPIKVQNRQFLWIYEVKMVKIHKYRVGGESATYWYKENKRCASLFHS